MRHESSGRSAVYMPLGVNLLILNSECPLFRVQHGLVAHLSKARNDLRLQIAKAGHTQNWCLPYVSP